MKTIELIRFHVAGVQHGRYTEIKDMHDGLQVDIVPEPENQYDPKAIRLDIQGLKIGYVPRAINEYVHANAGNLRAVVTKYDPTAYTHRAIEVTIYKDFPVPEPQ